MERTKSSYLWQNSPAIVRLLHADKPASDPVEARLTSGSSRRATVSSEKPFPPGAAVSVHVDGGLVMAEVDDCVRQNGGGYLTTLTIDQVVPSLSELGRLMDAILSTSGRSGAGSLERKTGAPHAVRD